MVPEKIKLNAQAKTLDIPNYRQMSLEELKSAIASAKGTKSAPIKGKVSTNGAKGTAATKTAVKGAVKGKVSAPAKSTVRKSKPATATAAKGTAKRAVKATPAKRKFVGKGSPARKIRATASTKGKVPAKRTGKPGPRVHGRVALDLRAIDWTAETRVGKSGKRAEVLKALKKTKNYAKAFDLLQDRAKAFYPSKTKYEAERMLVWLIGRVAFDFAMATEQHTPGIRAGYGQAKDPISIRRRELRAEREGVQRKGPSKRGRPAKGVAPAKVTPKPAAAPKKRGRPVGSVNKHTRGPVAARKPAGRPAKPKVTATKAKAPVKRGRPAKAATTRRTPARSKTLATKGGRR